MTHPTRWRKSSYSVNGAACVELAGTGPTTMLVRDSKHPDQGALAFSRPELAAFIAAARAGELDALIG